MPKSIQQFVEEKELTPKEWRTGLTMMAENIVSIQKGEKVGRWTREDRVALVYSVLYYFAKKSGAQLQEAKETMK